MASSFRKIPNSITMSPDIASPDYRTLCVIAAHLDFETGKGRVSDKVLDAISKLSNKQRHAQKMRLQELGLLVILEQGKKNQTSTLYYCPWLPTGEWKKPEAPKAESVEKPKKLPVKKPAKPAAPVAAPAPVVAPAPTPAKPLRPFTPVRNVLPTNNSNPPAVADMNQAQMENTVMMHALKRAATSLAKEQQSAALREAYRQHKLFGTPLPKELTDLDD